jgi:predicted ATPase/class 3 adenylate cyclase
MASMAELPAGTVTLLFTDIEGSTELLRRLGNAYGDVLAQHRHLLRAAFQAHDGHEVDTQGDAFFVAFSKAANAAAAAVEAQRALAAHDWPEEGAVRVRMGLHTGEPARTESGYVGMDVHHGARLMAAGHGGQVLLSEATRALVEHHLPPGVTLRDLGEHRLKDLAHPEQIHQLVIPGLAADFPQIMTLSDRPNNLPVQLTPILGRHQEVAAVCELLRVGRQQPGGAAPRPVRLLTLTGPGGTGKTRLALQVAADLVDHFDDGVFFVSLAPICDPTLVGPTIAGVLGVKEAPGQLAIAGVKEYLHEKCLLLVLDNLEQVVAGAPVITDLLTACPHLKVLVTSRTVLHLSGEYEFAVPPLALPRRRPPPPLEVLTQYASVQLFIDRAQALKPDFVITNENAPSVAEICHRLDGLPLAIELAAARIKLLPPQAMLARLEEHRLKFVTGGSRDLPERQRTLQGAISWSYDLLEAWEQALFRRLAVFTGGCTLEAAEAVCNPRDERLADPSYLDVFEGVASLLDKSLLWQQETVGEPRFFMLETIREFGLERLVESGEEDVVRRQHARFFLALAEAAYPKLLGSPEQARCLERLEREQDNLRSAFTWLVEHEPATGLRLAVALARFWRLTLGHETELRDVLERAIEGGGEAPVDVRIVSLREMGELLLRLGFGSDWAERSDCERAMEYLKQSAELSREAGDMANLAWTLRKLGSAAQYVAGDHESARAFFEESLAIERARGDKVATGNALTYCGSLARDQGDLETARAYYGESVGLFRAAQDQRNMARLLTLQAALAYMQRDFTRARSCYEKSLPVFRGSGDRGILVWALRYLGELAADYGDYEAARALNEEYLLVSRELEDSGGVVRALWGLAKAALGESHHAEARSLLKQIVMITRGSGNRMYLGNLLVDLARLDAEETQWERAARLCGAAEALGHSGDAALWSTRRTMYDAIVADATAALGETAFLAAFQEGRAMTPEQAATYALEEGAPG